jgi:hypothetical protein
MDATFLALLANLVEKPPRRKTELLLACEPVFTLDASSGENGQIKYQIFFKNLEGVRPLPGGRLSVLEVLGSHRSD